MKSGDYLLNKTLRKQNITKFFFIQLLEERSITLDLCFKQAAEANMGFPGGTVVKNQPANAGDARDTGSIPGSGRSPGAGNGNSLSILTWKIPWIEEPGGLQSVGSQESQTRLSTHTCEHDSG